MKYITFFHNSDTYLEEFTHPHNKNICFYWFSDSYYSHCGGYEYFCLFVKNPKYDNIRLQARPHGPGFHDLYKRYKEFSEERDAIFKRTSTRLSTEPPFLASYDKVRPDLIAKRDESRGEFIIIKPLNYKDKELKLSKGNKLPYKVHDEFKDEFRPIKFTEITEITEIVPHIKQSYPFIEPFVENQKYAYDHWFPMLTVGD